MELAELEAALAVVCGELNAAHAQLVSLVGDALESNAWHGWGIHSPAQWVAWQTGLSPARATEIVRIASRRSELPATVEAFEAGALTVDQVTVIARRVPGRYEASACELAKSATVAQLRPVVAAYPFENEVDHDAAAGGATDDPSAERCSFHVDDEGRFHLFAVGDVVGGATVEAALQQAKDALYRAGERDASWWDALVEVAERSLANPGDQVGRDRFRVHLHVDITDPAATVTRLTNGVGMPAWARDLLVCDATVQPVWVRDNVPIGVGRTSRAVPDRLRRLVLHRDHGRCQVPGCARTRVDIHHIDHWGHDGVTETWNLLSLCRHHHRLHHQGQLGMSGNPDRPGTLVFTDATGRRLPGCGSPAPPSTPSAPATIYRHASGERLYRHWVTLDPRPG